MKHILSTLENVQHHPPPTRPVRADRHDTPPKKNHDAMADDTVHTEETPGVCQ
jgi:hypothetical protein